MRVHLRVAVEQLAEQRAAGALDLRDEHERLMDRNEVRKPLVDERAVLVRLAELDRHQTRASSGERRRPGEEGVDKPAVALAGRRVDDRPAALEHREHGVDAPRPDERLAPAPSRRELEPATRERGLGIARGKLVSQALDQLGRDRRLALPVGGVGVRGADALVPRG